MLALFVSIARLREKWDYQLEKLDFSCQFFFFLSTYFSCQFGVCYLSLERVPGTDTQWPPPLKFRGGFFFLKITKHTHIAPKSGSMLPHFAVRYLPSLFSIAELTHHRGPEVSLSSLVRFILIWSTVFNSRCTSSLSWKSLVNTLRW